MTRKSQRILDIEKRMAAECAGGRDCAVHFSPLLVGSNPQGGGDIDKAIGRTIWAKEHGWDVDVVHAEALIAEIDRLRATVQRVEALADGAGDLDNGVLVWDLRAALDGP